MPLSGSIVPRYYASSPVADAPYPTNLNTSGAGLEDGEIFICTRTGRMWMQGTVSPFYIPLALHYQFTNSGATTTNAHIRRKNVGASGSEVAAFELAGAVALTDLVSKVALGTDSYGKIVAATLSAATLLGRRGGASGDVEQITLGNGLKISSGASPALSVDGSVIPASSTSMLAGTGLTGGGDLSTDRTFSVDFAASGTSSSTKAVRADDSRLSDARTPTAHVHSAADVTSGTLDIARIPTGTSSSTVCIGNDARLSDARTPTAHTHVAADVTDFVSKVDQEIEDGFLKPSAPSLFRDEFVSLTLTTGLIGELGWRFTNGSVAHSAPEADHFGIIQRVSGATANQVASFYLSSSTTNMIFRWEDFVEMTFCLKHDASTTDFGVRYGISSDAAAAAPGIGVYFERQSANSYLSPVVKNGASTNLTVVQWTIDTNWHTYKIKRVSQDSVEFSVDGGTVYTESIGGGNGIANSASLQWFFQITPTVNSARNFRLDFFSSKLRTTTR